MNDIHRDLGRIEATQEIMVEDVKKIKADLAEIKDSISNAKAIKSHDWRRLTIIGTIAGASASQLLEWIKPLFHHGG